MLATRTALLQHDGDMVGFDGVSPIAFDAAPGGYAIAIRHRNHLGVMTAAGIALTSSLRTSTSPTRPRPPMAAMRRRR